MTKSTHEPVLSSEMSRTELVDAIGRLRAVLLVGKPALPPDQQTMAQHILESTLIRNDEPQDLPEVGLTFEHDTKLLTISLGDLTSGSDLQFEDSSHDDYLHLERVFSALTAGGKLVCEG